MRRKMQKLNHWLLISDHKNKFFNKRIKWQLHSLISYFLYPELRSVSISKIIRQNKYLILLVSSIIFLSTSTFIIGRIKNISYIEKIESMISDSRNTTNLLKSSLFNKNLTIIEMSKEVRSRDYLEYKIIKRSHIESIDNFKKIPDSIFFTMTEVIEKYKIPEVVFFRIMERESKFQFIDNKEGSSAKGYMQVVKSTFDQHYKKLNLLGGHNKENNIKVAASLLSTIHEFWKTQFPKDNRKSWEYSICEYGCGRLPMITNNGFIIPSESRPGIDYVMSYY